MVGALDVECVLYSAERTARPAAVTGPVRAAGGLGAVAGTSPHARLSHRLPTTIPPPGRRRRRRRSTSAARASTTRRREISIHHRISRSVPSLPYKFSRIACLATTLWFTKSPKLSVACHCSIPSYLVLCLPNSSRPSAN